MRVTVAEDSALVREGLIGLLDRFSHTVVTAVGDAPGLVGAVHRERPDLVLTDVRMLPGEADDGLRAAVELRTTDPALPVLVLSQYVEPVAAEGLLDTGDGAGVGYLLKDRVADVTAFAAAMERVVAGAPCSIPRWCSDWCGAGVTRWDDCPRGNARCWT